MSDGTVTVDRERTDSFSVSFSALPGEFFGPFCFAETVRELTVSALLSTGVARDLVLRADADGAARADVGAPSLRDDDE